MKRLTIYFTSVLIFSALVLFFSCDADKLELTNPNQLSPDTYFKTPAQVQSAVNAVYGSLQTTGMYNRCMWYSSENMGHENTCNSQQEADKREWLNFSFGPNHGLMEAYWSSCYRGINKANFVINNEQAMTDNIATSIMSEATRNRFIGEAKFLRALYYFFLVTRYGDVPLYLGIDPAEKDGLARTPKEQVWAQIEADCEDAAAKCLSKAAEQPGRATSGAAWALLGKARLYQKNYQGALIKLPVIHSNLNISEISWKKPRMVRNRSSKSSLTSKPVIPNNGIRTEQTRVKTNLLSGDRNMVA
jgi:hypothetical protein